MRILFLSLLVLSSCFVVMAADPEDHPVKIIRVGAITYADYNTDYVEKQQALNQLAKLYNESDAGKKQNISFQLWVSSYDDILDWYKNGWIDVAFLSPGPTAVLLVAQKNDELRDLYIGTAVLPPADANNLFASPERHKPGDHVSYHTVCVVNNKSDIRTWDDLQKQIKAKKVDFLFVHPLSASGRILPEYVLRNRKGIDATDLHKELTEVQWTYDHQATIRALEQPSASGNTKVAFLWDGALNDATARAQLRKIPIPEFEELSIPQEVVLISSNFKDNKELVKNIFVPKKPEYKTRYVELRDWVEQYAGIVTWVRELGLTPNKLEQSSFNLQQILQKVQNYESSHPKGARIALVLSGGGAKCAYQIGVIRAIENEINELNKKPTLSSVASTADNKTPTVKPRPLNIGLVVGTSGGAINALSVALGLTRTEEGQDALQNVWLSFHQQDFFRPWSPVPFSGGLMLGFGQVFVIIVALRLFDEKKIEWRRSTRFVVGSLAAIAVLLSFTSWRFWASIPLMIMIVFVGIQLFENQTDKWRTQAALLLFIIGLLELVVIATGITPWNATPWKATAWDVFPYVMFGAGLLLTAIVTVLGTRVFSNDAAKWRKYFYGVMILTAIALSLALFWSGASVEHIARLSRNHLLHHFWLALILNLPIASICLLVIGALMFAAEVIDRRGSLTPPKQRARLWAYSVAQGNREFFANRKPLLRSLAVALIFLFCLQFWRSLFVDPSLSSSEGIDHAFVEKLPALLEKHPDVKSPIVLRGTTDKEKLADLSDQIINKGWLRRDLIITTSRLSDGDDASRLSEGDEASDLYFFNRYSGEGAYQKESPDQRRFSPDSRFKSFARPEFTDHLLDVIIGSATIYPVFKPREFSFASPDADGNLVNLDLIDGGFAHNSPIEAAVAWDATHIILVEASPKPKPPKPSSDRHLLDNSLDAFNYLFNEAQLTDARSRGKIEIFSIRPDSDEKATSPNLCTFDFDESLMRDKITEGLNDALRYPPKFVRQRGQPN